MIYVSHHPRGCTGIGRIVCLKLGVEHTVITRWNRLFHHGKWLETTIERPFLARFEDDGGFLPMHYAGIEVGGKLATLWGELKYTAILSNGRGLTPEDRQLLSDKNDAKAIEVALSFAPARWSGFQLGAAFRFDEIPPDRSNIARAEAIQELIWSAYVEWRAHALELLGEFVLLQHQDRTSDQTFRHASFYVQASYRLGVWTPYGRFDYRNMAAGDPFFAPTDGDLDRWEQIFGLRYDFINQGALKLEFGFGQFERRLDGGNVRLDWFVTSALQLAWFF